MVSQVPLSGRKAENMKIQRRQMIEIADKVSLRQYKQT
jgi:hypothetical protein